MVVVCVVEHEDGESEEDGRVLGSLGVLAVLLESDLCRE